MARQIPSYQTENRGNPDSNVYITFLRFDNFDATGIEAEGKPMKAVFGVFESEAFYNTLKTNIITHTDSIPIIALDQGAKTFTIAGDSIALFDSMIIKITISGSTGNDGSYTIVSTALDGENTKITVSEAISDATVDGNLGRIRSHPLINDENKRIGTIKLNLTHAKYMEFVAGSQTPANKPEWAGKNLRDIFRTQLYEWAKDVDSIIGDPAGSDI